MIALTGAGGFIGSFLLGYLNKLGITDVVLFDDLTSEEQFKNLVNKKFISLHSTEELFESAEGIDGVIHLGANSSTLAKDWSSVYKTNVLSTRTWYHFCKNNNIPFIFSSSAAVYGNGNGPLNQYAFSKQLSENEISDAVILRFFNVYGPNEYHKGRMASTPFHWFNQLKQTGELRIFENSHEYFRDFIYVEDVAKVILHFLKNPKPGTYDLGTGAAESFEAVADAVIQHYGSGVKSYIPMPDDIIAQYQKHTQANIENLEKSGFDTTQLRGVDKGIAAYFEYLKSDLYY